MRKLLFLLCLISATSSMAWAQFFISPSGTDSNSGTSIGSPWLTPNHAMTCGQTIQAAAGTYSAANFQPGKWGTVSCPSANNVAWLQCATFDTCKISTSSAQGIYVDKSFWGVTGFEVTASSTFGTCFLVQSAVNHIIFANDVANGCTQGGFSMNHGDYMIEAGDIAYNTALGSSSCTSGFNIWEPAQSDTVAGTHMYVAGNYAWNNEEPNPCGGTAPTDGEGLIFDTFSNSTYTQQAVAQNNIFVSNGGRGIEANFIGTPHFYVEYNTLYGNNNQAGQAFPSGNGEIVIEANGSNGSSGSSTVTNNLAMTSQATTGGSAIYAATLTPGTSANNTFSGNWLYSAAGNTTTGSGFGSNTTGTNPAFVSTTIPGAPSCSGAANVAACAATLIANFTPTAGGASAFGYQPISNTSVNNPLFPAWLCNGNALIAGFPSGIITPGCSAAPVSINSGMTTSQIQTAINGAAAGSTIAFAAGTYNLTAPLTIPCTGGTIYTGPLTGQAVVSYTSAGVQTVSNLPTANLTEGTITNYAMRVNANGGTTYTSPTGGCTIQYLNFNGTQGGIYVPQNSSGYTIQFNEFQQNNPAFGGSNPRANIYLDGTTNSTAGASAGQSYYTIQWNYFLNNCLSIRTTVFPDQGGNCASTWVNAYENHGVWTNNIVNGTEEGYKGGANPVNFPIMNNFTETNNNMQGNSRILTEIQHNSNGSANFSHNAFYQPYNPSYNTFELSLPIPQSTSPTAQINDNAIIGNVPILAQGSGAHYGIGIEIWGVGASGQGNLLQGGNGVSSCQGGIPCSGWVYSIGGPNTNQNWRNNYGSGYDINQIGMFTYEDGASSSSSGFVFTPNTTVATSTTQATIAPTLSPAGGNYSVGQTITISDSDTLHALSYFYTTDGTTPCIFGPGGSCGTTHLYTAPFPVTLPTTVKAIAHWGQGANQGIVFPSFGWVPSSVNSATYATSGGGTPALTGVTLACANGATTLGVGASLQCNATCVYGSTTTTSCNAADQFGNDASFTSANPADFTVNATGAVTGVAAGTANLTTTVGAFTSSPLALTVTAPAPVLQSVFINCGGVNSLSVGQTVQCSAQCQYSGNITTNCTTADTYGTTAGSWTSSVPGDATVSSGGLVTAVAAGTSNITVKAASFTSNIYTFTLTSATPPAATLTGVSVTGANTVTAGQTLSLGAQCTYSDLSTTNCTTTDAHGTTAGSWASSAAGVATINSSTGVLTGVSAGTTNVTVHAGSFTSTAATITVTAVPATTICGVNQVTTSFAGTTAANYFNSTYCVTGTNAAGYNSTSGSFYLPAGTQTSGALWDLVVIPATSGTAQAAAAICKGTYTTSGTVAPAAWITVAIGQVGAPATQCHLAPSTAYWIGVITNEAGTPGQGFYNCGGTCAGTLPTLGSGTYPYRYQSNVYGTYTGMNTALIGGATVQSSQYITLGAPPPTLTGGYQNSTPTLNTSVITPGVTLQLNVFCTYSDGSVNQCFPTPDQYGSTVTACTSTNTSVFTVASLSASPPCLVTGISGGSAFRDITLTGGVPANPYSVTTQTSSNNPVPGGPHRPHR